MPAMSSLVSPHNLSRVRKRHSGVMFASTLQANLAHQRVGTECATSICRYLEGCKMDHKFQLGCQVKASAEGLRKFRNWHGRRGTIVGRSRDEKVWEVRWLGRPKTELIHEIFIAPFFVGSSEREHLGERWAEAD